MKTFLNMAQKDTTGTQYYKGHCVSRGGRQYTVTLHNSDKHAGVLKISPWGFRGKPARRQIFVALKEAESKGNRYLTGDLSLEYTVVKARVFGPYSTPMGRTYVANVFVSRKQKQRQYNSYRYDSTRNSSYYAPFNRRKS